MLIYAKLEETAMNKKIVIVLTEGPQDASFVYYLLKQSKFDDVKAKMTENDMPLFAIIQKHIGELYPDNKKIQVDGWQLALPYLIQKEENGETLFCAIYSIGGKDQYRKAKSILKKYLDLYFGNSMTFTKMSFAIIYDTDHDLKNAISSISDNYKIIENESKKKSVGSNSTTNTLSYILTLPDIKHNTSHYVKIQKGEKEFDFHFGFYFLPGNYPIGNLDFLTLPLMQNKNKEVFKNSETFIINNEPDFSQSPIDIEERVKKTTTYYKTVLGVAGQLKFAGSSNAVFYKKGVYLDDEIIDEPQCKDIIKLITNLFE